MSAVRIRELKTHPEPYVTVAELAAYWLVGRKQIYKQIDAGTLAAIRLGPRLLRIRTSDALEFERLAKMRPADYDAYERAAAVGGSGAQSTRPRPSASDSVAISETLSAAQARLPAI